MLWFFRNNFLPILLPKASEYMETYISTTNQ